MEIESSAASVTSSVMQFNYDGYCINILDTPGHQDFSEDTYRTLMAADSAVMVIDSAKGVENQTKKLFKVCTMRNIPIFTFINKMDRDAQSPFDLLEEIEQVLGIETYPMNWPIGCGKEFKGVYDRTKRNYRFSHTGKIPTKHNLPPLKRIWATTIWTSCSQNRCTTHWLTILSCWTAPPMILTKKRCAAAS